MPLLAARLASETLASETFTSNKPGIKTKFEIKQEAPKMITLRGTVRCKTLKADFGG
jgi:hypothetical protein